jgi:hypothetical protein
MSVLNAAHDRAEKVRTDVWGAVQSVHAELHERARAATDRDVRTRWVQMALNITLADLHLGEAVTAAADALVIGEPALTEWERK